MKTFVTAQAHPGGGEISDADFERLQQRITTLRNQIADTLPGAVAKATEAAVKAAVAVLKTSEPTANSSRPAWEQRGYRLPQGD